MASRRKAPHAESTFAGRSGRVACLVGIVGLTLGVFGLQKWRQPDHSSEAVRRALTEVRAAIDTFKRERAAVGSDRFPTLVELQTPGIVLADAIPTNALARSDSVVPASAQTGASDPVAGEGWCYDESTGRFWSASGVRGSNRW